MLTHHQLARLHQLHQLVQQQVAPLVVHLAAHTTVEQVLHLRAAVLVLLLAAVAAVLLLVHQDPQVHHQDPQVHHQVHQVLLDPQVEVTVEDTEEDINTNPIYHIPIA